ncbi:ribosome maturation factor RimM [Paraburkholderia ferrariae]|uniref:ribosome maturation factor RimM n=1 Tax=Paraburkholderia ferrariae TaxID=386056 RepID=UPI000A02D75D|nr:ribosome maturation factor RimM [Paraburkholderia ferrariae]
MHDDPKAGLPPAETPAAEKPRKGAAEGSQGNAGRRAASPAPSFGAFVRKPACESATGAPKAEAQSAEGLRPETEASFPADAVEVGAVIEAYGLKGWVKVAPHAQGGSALLAAKRWWLLKGRGGREIQQRQSTQRIAAKVHGDSVVAQLAGVDDREAAERLRGSRIYVSRADFPALKADEYYWVDLLGLDVANEAGVELGKVADLIDNGAQSVLRVEYPSTGKDGKPATGERLIPFVGVYVKTVDLAAKRIVVDWDADY